MPTAEQVLNFCSGFKKFSGVSTSKLPNSMISKLLFQVFKPENIALIIVRISCSGGWEVLFLGWNFFWAKPHECSGAGFNLDVYTGFKHHLDKI